MSTKTAGHQRLRSVVAGVCSLALAFSMIPAIALQSAFADEGGIAVDDKFTSSIPFAPTDPQSEQDSFGVTFQVKEYDEDTATGTVSLSAVSSKTIPGKLSLPETVTYEGSTFTVIGIDSYVFENATGMTGFDFPETLTTIGSGAFQYAFNDWDYARIPASVNFIGKRAFASRNTVGLTYPDDFELMGDASAINFGDGSYQWMYGCRSGARVNLLCWGDSWNSNMDGGGVISPGKTTNTTPSRYIWLAVTYYNNKADAEAHTNPIGTAWVSPFSIQTVSDTGSMSGTTVTSTRFTIGSYLNKTNEASSYFYKPGHSSAATVLADYPAFPEGTDKWMAVGNPNPSAGMSEALDLYPVKADESSIDQGYYEGLESSYVVNGSDIDTASQVKVYDCNGNAISTDKYDVVYQRYDEAAGQWVEAPAGERGTFMATYRLAISAKNGSGYTGSLTTATYLVKGPSKGETFAYKVKHIAPNGTEDMIDCNFTVLTEGTSAEPGTVSTIANANATATSKAVDTNTEGTVVLPSTLDIAGVPYTLTAIGNYSFGGGSTATTSCTKLTDVVIPDTVTAIGNAAFARVPLEGVRIPASVKTVGATAYFDGQLSTSSYAAQSKYTDAHEYIRFDGNASGVTLQSNTFGETKVIDILFCGDSKMTAACMGFQYLGYNAWYQVEFYASAEADEPIGEVFVPAGTCLSDVLNGTAATFKDATVALPAGATCWTAPEGADLFTPLASGGARLIASSAAATDLAGAHVSGISHPFYANGEDQTPALTVYGSDGAAIDPSAYSVSYQVKSGEEWAAAESVKDVGSYRAVITPADGSALTGSLTAGFELTRVAMNQIVTYPAAVIDGLDVSYVDIDYTITKVADGAQNDGEAILGYNTTSVKEVVSGSATVNDATNNPVHGEINGTLVLPSELKIGDETYVVVEITNAALTYKAGLTGVVLPDHLKTIAANAFAYDNNLKRVVIPAEVTSLGSYAFRQFTAASSALKEIVFEGTAPTTSLSTIFYNRANSAKWVFAAEDTARALTLASTDSAYYAVDYYASFDDYINQSSEPTRVFMNATTTLASASASDLYSGEYNSNSIPELPEGSEGWQYVLADGSKFTGTALGSVATTRFTGQSLVAYPAAAENSLRGYSFEVNIKGADYPATGSNIVPMYMSILNADGETLDADKYAVGYQRQDTDGTWADTADGASPGTLRLKVTPVQGSGLVDELYSPAYTITKADYPDESAFNYPVLIEASTGQKYLENQDFILTGDTTAKTTAASDAVAGLVLTRAQQVTVHLPETVYVNDKTASVTALGRSSFALDSDNCTLLVPKTVANIERDLNVDTTNNPYTRRFFRTLVFGDGAAVNSIEQGAFGWQYLYNGAAEAIYEGAVSNYLAATAPTVLAYGNTNAKTFGVVRFYASQEAYEAGTVLATTGVGVGTEASTLAFNGSYATAKAYDSKPSLPTGMNAWKIVDASGNEVSDLSKTVTDGTLSAIAVFVDDKDLANDIVTNQYASYIATGEPVEPVTTVTEYTTGDVVDSKYYTLSYERQAKDGSWAATDDLTTPGTLRTLATAAELEDGADNPYSGTGVSQPWAIEGASNEVGAYIPALVDYLPAGEWTPDEALATVQTQCWFQVLVPVDGDEPGMVRVVRSPQSWAASSTTGTHACVDESLTGTLVLPGTVTTAAGSYKVVSAGVRFSYDSGSTFTYNNSNCFWDTNLSGIVFPDTLSIADYQAATAGWTAPGSATNMGAVFVPVGRSHPMTLHFAGNAADYTIQGNGLPGDTTYATVVNYAGTPTTDSAFLHTTFYASAADAEAQANPLGTARVANGTKLAALAAGEAGLFGSDAAPALSSGCDYWLVSGDTADSSSVSEAGLSLYASTLDALDLSQGYLAAGSVRSKDFDGEALEPAFTLMAADGAEVDPSCYELSYARRGADGSWAATDDLSGMGTVRITATAKEGNEGGYTGAYSFNYTIQVPKVFSVPATLVAADGTESAVPMNVELQSFNKTGGVITVAIAPTASGRPAIDQLSEGTLVIADGVKMGDYTVKIAGIRGGAFGNAEQELACNYLAGVEISAAKMAIAENSFAKCQSLASVTLSTDGSISIAAGAFESAPVEKVVLAQGADGVSIVDGAFRYCADIADVLYGDGTVKADVVWGTSAPTSWVKASAQGIDEPFYVRAGAKAAELTNADVYGQAADVTLPQGAYWAAEGDYDEEAGIVTAPTALTREIVHDLALAEVAGVEESYDWPGEAVVPAPVVTVGGVELTEGTDYTVEITGNDAPGTATVKITGLLEFEGTSTEVTFEIKAADASALEEAVEAAEALTESEYTESSWADLAEALEAAKALDTAKATQAQTDAAAKTLTDAIDALVSTKELAEALEAAKALDTSKMAPSSASALAEAIAGAEEVLVKPDAAADEVAAAKEALDAATEGAQQLFDDVKSPSSWYFDVVYAAVDAGLVSGYTGKNLFGPNDNIARRDVAVILWRAAGSQAPTSAPSFPDVKADAYYADAVAWCSENGVVTGYANGKFGSGDNITRQDLMVMLARYMKASGGSDKWRSLKNSSKVYSYAQSAVAWGVDSGVIGGDGNINPLGKATRAEATKMIYVALGYGL